MSDLITIPAIEDLTRRRLIGSALAAALLAACGSDDDDGGDTSTREIRDYYGTVTVPTRPERVIASWHHHIGNMLALGVTPIGMIPQASDFPLPGHAEALAAVPGVGSDAGLLDIEKALALNPDLILEIGESWNDEVCDRAKRAVATACFPYDYTTADGIKQSMRDVGEALGLSDEAEAFIKAYDDRVAGLKQRFAAAGFAGKRVANIFWTTTMPTGFFVPVDRPSNLVLRSLDIPEPEFQADPSVGEIEFSFESLTKLNEAWAVIIMVTGEATRASLEANPLWHLIEPVKAGRAIFVDGRVWECDYLAAMMQMLDDVEAQLLPLT